MASERVRSVLDHVWSALESLGHPSALMGGMGMAVWNYPRATRDIDFLIEVDSENFERVVERLRGSGCRPKKEPPLFAVGRHHFAQFLYTPPGEFYDVQFDLLLAESELQKSAIQRRVQRKVAGVTHPIDVLRCEDLILFKLLAGRIIDRADAAMLLRENREEIDFDYVMSWVSSLKLTTDFSEIWHEAFPNDAMPGTLS